MFVRVRPLVCHGAVRPIMTAAAAGGIVPGIMEYCAKIRRQKSLWESYVRGCLLELTANEDCVLVVHADPSPPV